MLKYTSADLFNRPFRELFGVGSCSRLFFEGWPLPDLTIVESVVVGFGATIVERERKEGRGCSPIWALRFTFSGYEFLVDMNYHTDDSLFFVNNIDCPDDFLLNVLQHFDGLFARPMSEINQPQSTFTLETEDF